MKVLVVDDNPVNQRLLQVWLTRQGHEPTMAETGEQALALLAGKPFDLALLDMMLPDMSGVEVARQWRSSGQPRADVPMLALTANSQEADRQACLAAGMNEFLSKPIDFNRLAALLAQYAAPVVVTQACSFKPEAMLDSMGGDQDIAQMFMSMLPEQLPVDWQQFSAAVQARDAETASRGAHSIKGIARQAVASELAEVAQMLETDCKNADWVAVTGRLAAFESALKRFMADVDQYLLHHA